MDATALSLAQLSDQELLAKVTELAAEEREATVLLIAHLAELDARRLHLAEGYSSLFGYYTVALHLSEDAAYTRIVAARASRRFPVLLRLLSDGSLTLTAARLLAPHLTAENHEGLLHQARHQNKRGVEELLARVSPRPAVPPTMRRLPAPRTQEPQPDLAGLTTTELVEPLTTAQLPPRRLATVTPLAPERYKVQFTASAGTHQKLLQVQNLLRHQVLDGDLDQVIDRALTALLNELAKKMLAAAEHPRQARPTGFGSRHIPAEVKRAVWFRDGGQCAFVSKKGRRCNEISYLEFHHIEPHAAGGPATVSNIQLRCRAHNAGEAELQFGPRNYARVAEGAGAERARSGPG